MGDQDEDASSQSIRRSTRTIRRPPRFIEADEETGVDGAHGPTLEDALEDDQERETFENWESNDAIQDEGDLVEDRRDDGNEQLVYGPVSWGEMRSVEEVHSVVERVHLKIKAWKNNIFNVPRGKIGKEFIDEATRLMRLFNRKMRWEPLALNLLIIYFPLMLQKPSQRSKNKDHVRYLTKRLSLWKEGCLDKLLSEGEEIQKRMTSKNERKKESNLKGFRRLMMEGKVRQALKLVDSENDIAGIHTINSNIKDILKEKHPQGETLNAEVLLSGVPERVEEVTFERIDGHVIQEASKKMNGSGGPTKIDADVWKHILCSKVFGNKSSELAEEVAVATRRLCIEDIPHKFLHLLLDCRLVPLMKEDNGVRPVGVGKVLRRIMCKAVVSTLGLDVQLAGGSLQTCTGVEAGIEAAIHAMAKIFKDDSCEAALLVDADNAFNRLNRKVTLHNLQHQCPPISRFLSNTYKEPAKLHLGDGSHILSEEGTTQGDPLAMAMYAISTRPLIESLKTNAKDVAQVWFADDSAGAGKIRALKLWWDHLKEIGPKYGYYPKPSKTYLIVKNEQILIEAKELFDGEEIKFTADGHRHVGAVIGTETFRNDFVSGKVEKWVKDVNELAEIAKEEPQAALCAYNMGLSQRWTFVQRTIKDISFLFEPLEEAIRNILIPAICGKVVSDIERKLISLPYKYGGLGIRNPVETCKDQFDQSLAITSELTQMICQQDLDLSKLNKSAIKEKKKEVVSLKEKKLKESLDALIEAFDEKTKRLVMCAGEKGASAWLSSLPLKKYGYNINKREFKDALCLRYGWPIQDMPNYCACGLKNDMDHILTCKKGGYVSMRHNAIRDTEAKIMKEVCSDIKIEPNMLPVGMDKIIGNNADNARLDISARGVWRSQERTFFDVRVTHPTAASHLKKSMEALYRENENEKKRAYNDRVMNIEKGAFTPLVFSTTGGMGPECTRLNKQLAELISQKTGEVYAHVMRHLRTRLRFALLRATLVAVRGYRGQKGRSEEIEIEDISFNLIPEMKDF